MSATAATARTLAELLPEFAGTAQGAVFALSGLSLDSREARRRGVDRSRRGAQHDGMAFAADALGRGARVVLVDAASGAATPSDAIVAVSGLAERVSEIAGRFYGDPSRELTLFGVTGTNGKTTCTQLIAAALESLGTRCGVIGTLGWGFPGRLDATRHTTPDAVSIQRMLGALRAGAHGPRHSRCLRTRSNRVACGTSAHRRVHQSATIISTTTVRSRTMPLPSACCSRTPGFGMR